MSELVLLLSGLIMVGLFVKSNSLRQDETVASMSQGGWVGGWVGGWGGHPCLNFMRSLSGSGQGCKARGSSITLWLHFPRSVCSVAIARKCLHQAFPSLRRVRGLSNPELQVWAGRWEGTAKGRLRSHQDWAKEPVEWQNWCCLY